MKRFLHAYVIPPLACALIYVISATLRVTEAGKDMEDELEKEGGPIIYTFWHGRLFYYPYYYKRRERYRILVSPSVDGEIIARTLALFGFGITRGSSFKNSRAALRELKRSLDEGYSTVLIADGSRGPRHALQPGALMLAKLTGRPALPMTVSFSSYWTINSWDRLIIPKPFAKAVVIYGPPVRVDGGCGAEELEAKRRELENTLLEITELADNFFSGK